MRALYSKRYEYYVLSSVKVASAKRVGLPASTSVSSSSSHPNSAQLRNPSSQSPRNNASRRFDSRPKSNPRRCARRAPPSRARARPSLPPLAVHQESRYVIPRVVHEPRERVHRQRRARHDEQVALGEILARLLAEPLGKILAEEHDVGLDQRVHITRIASPRLGRRDPSPRPRPPRAPFRHLAVSKLPCAATILSGQSRRSLE